ncbi:hypothetical protein U1Q18_043130 [Sarracenia purpurea var. burkii]
MGDAWDLHAVVTGRTSAAVPVINSHHNHQNHNNTTTEDPLPELGSLTFDSDDLPFFYPGFAEDASFQFEGLEEIYQSFNSPPPTNNSNSSISILGGLGNQRQTQLLPPSQQQLIQQEFENSRTSSSLTNLPAFHSQSVRSRKRKNQQAKLVRQMTHEELLADSWAWRKYGQKPIKGSPYPRNYYRCSTSKGCAARKQVEKSSTDPNIYVVSYSGEHTHPRPTHRNSLAGSSRNKFSSAVLKPTSGGCNSSEPPSATLPNPSCPSSSPVSTSSFSPTTPSIDGETAPHEKTQSETLAIKDDDDDAEMEGITEYDEDLLIPNTVMNEDILKGFEELKGGFANSGRSDSRGAIASRVLTQFSD